MTVTTGEPAELRDALDPDVGAIPGDATVETAVGEGELRVTIEAPDLSSLRAGVGTWTKLVAVATSVGGTDG